MTVPSLPGSWIAVSLLLLLATGCGGVLNPPRSAPTSTPRPLRATATVAPTPTPAPERWVKNHRVTDMWSGPASDRASITFGETSSAFCSFRIVREEDDARMLVYNPYLDGQFWIDSDTVGPVQSPERRPGPKPESVNCAEVVYTGTATTTPVLAATPTSSLPTPGVSTPAARPGLGPP